MKAMVAKIGARFGVLPITFPVFITLLSESRYLDCGVFIVMSAGGSFTHEKTQLSASGQKTCIMRVVFYFVRPEWSIACKKVSVASTEKFAVRSRTLVCYDGQLDHP